MGSLSLSLSLTHTHTNKEAAAAATTTTATTWRDEIVEQSILKMDEVDTDTVEFVGHLFQTQHVRTCFANILPVDAKTTSDLI